jgi:transposase-like protein
MQLSEFQLRARVVELERQNAELLMESQRLAKENFELREARKAA